MPEEKKEIEFTDNELEKVNGGVSLSGLCPCDYFSPKNGDNNNQHYKNCTYWSDSLNSCKALLEAEGE